MIALRNLDSHARTCRKLAGPLLPGLALLALAAAAPGQATHERLPLGPATAADSPMGLAVTPDGRSALIVHWATDNLTVLDLARGRVTDTIAVGDGPIDVAVVPGGRVALVPNLSDGDVSVVDLVERVEVGRIDVSIAQPHRILVSDDGRFAVVASPPGDSFEFATIDLALGAELVAWQTNLTSHSVQADGLALDPAGSRLIVSALIERSVNVYEITTGSLLATRSAPSSIPEGLTVRPDGTSVVVQWAGWSGLRGISLLSLEDYTWGANFPFVPGGFKDTAWLPDGATLAIAGGNQGLVFVNVDTFGSTKIPDRAGSVELTADGRYLVATTGPELLLVDVPSRTVVDRQPTRAIKDLMGKGLVAAPPRRGQRTGDVVMLELVSETVRVARVEEGALRLDRSVLTGVGPERDQPVQLELLADGRRAVTVNRASRNISLVDLERRAVLWDLDVGPLPSAMALTPDDRALVVDEEALTLTVADLGLDQGRVLQRLVLPGQPVSVVLGPVSEGQPQRAYVLLRDTNLAAVAVELHPDGAVLAESFPWATSYTNRGELLVTDDGARVFVAVSNRLLEFDAASGQLLSETFSFPDHLVRVGSDRLALFLSNKIEVFDISTTPPTLLAKGGPCGNVRALEADESGRVLFASCMTAGLFGGELMALEADTLALLDTLPLPEGPVSIARAGERLVVGSLSAWAATFAGGFLSLVGSPQPLFGWFHELDLSPELGATIWTYEDNDLIEIVR